MLNLFGMCVWEEGEGGMFGLRQGCYAIVAFIIIPVLFEVGLG